MFLVVSYMLTDLSRDTGADQRPCRPASVLVWWCGPPHDTFLCSTLRWKPSTRPDLAPVLCPRLALAAPPLRRLDSAVLLVARHLPSLKGNNPSDLPTSQHPTHPIQIQPPPTAARHGHQHGGHQDAREHARLVRPDHGAHDYPHTGRLDREPHDLQAIGRKRRAAAL
jgi:hypothetical protein